MIIAVDFDGTLCEACFPNIGRPNMELIRKLKNSQKLGDKLILWTCRNKEDLEAAVNWCSGFGLFFDAINQNLPENIALYGGDTRKVFADVYIDDHAIAPWEYSLKEAEGAIFVK